MSETVAGFIPLMVFVALITWAAVDHEKHKRRLHASYLLGVNNAFERIRPELMHEIQKLTKGALKGIDAKYNLGVKVIETRDASRDFYSGEVTESVTTLSLPALHYSIQISPKKMYFDEYARLKNMDVRVLNEKGQPNARG